MKFHILTLFPEMVLGGLGTSILGNAMEKDLIEINAVNIRDYTKDKHGKVDDYTYGGGAGMLMQAQPVYDAYKAVCNLNKAPENCQKAETGMDVRKKIRTIYVTPQGIPFSQKLAREFAREEELIFLCGHYEGIDERVLEEIVTDYVSIGDYVLTGGELPAMVMIDAISRLVPEVLGNEESAQTESFHNDLLEYPQYSRPEEWHGKKVPEVLLSGNHKLIEAWRRDESEKRTKERRPDLYQKYKRKQKLIKALSKDKRNNIHMIESLSRGKSEILYAENGNVLLFDEDFKLCMISAQNKEAGEKLVELIPKEVQFVISSQAFLNDLICEKCSFVLHHECFQVCYTNKVSLPVRYKDIRPLTLEHLDYVAEHYEMTDREYVKERLLKKAMYGAFAEDKLVGFIGIHAEGSAGLLYVEEAYRRQGIGRALEAFLINWHVKNGYTPYGHVVKENEISLKMQESMGFYVAKNPVFWLGSKDSKI